MRIQTGGNYVWRKDLYDEVADRFDEGTRSGGLDAASELILEPLGKPGSRGPPARKEAPHHPDMTPELAEILSTNMVKLKIVEERDLRVK